MSGQEIVGTARRTIQQLRSLGAWDEGHEYITGLPEVVRSHKQVIIEAAQLYLMQGHYARAWDMCEPTHKRLSSLATLQEPLRRELNAETICLWLLSAYISISRHGKIATALDLADRLRDLVADDVFTQRVQSSTSADLASKGVGHTDFTEHTLSAPIMETRAAAHCRGCHGVSEIRILIQFWLWKILLCAAEQGFLDEVPTKREAASKLDEIRLWTLEHDRLREARYITYAQIGLLKDTESDMECLRQLLASVRNSPAMKVEEAQTHLDLARCLLNLERDVADPTVSEHLNRAATLFTEVRHTYGMLDLKDMQLTQIRGSLILEEFLKRKIELGDAYFEKHCYQQGIKCLIFAIPVSHELGHVQDETTKMIEHAQKEIRKVGATFQEQALFVCAVAQTLVRAPEYGYGRKSLEDYLSRLPEETGPIIEVQLRTSMSMASANSGNTDEAARQAEMAFEAALKTPSYDERSAAAFLLAVSRIRQATALGNKSVAMLALSNASILLRLWASLDKVMGCHIQAADKFAWLASVELQANMLVGDELALERLDRWLDEARQISNIHDIVSEKVYEMEILRAARLQDYDTPVRIARERLDVAKAVSASSHFHRAQHSTQLSICLYRRFCARARTMGQLSANQRETVAKDYSESIQQANEAYSLYSKAGGSEMIITSLNYLFDLLSEFPFDNMVDILKSWLEEATKIENFCDAMRRSVAMTFNVQSLLEKRMIISGKQYRKLYDNAFEACKKIDDAAAAWLWVQKSKARSLSDVFGIRAVLPVSLLASIQADSGAYALFEKERLLGAAALEKGPLEYLNARRLTEEVQVLMKEHPLLRQVLDLREGAFNIGFSQEALSESLALSGATSEDIKYVEWYVPHETSSETKIILLVRALDGSTIMRELSITTGSIESWIKRRLVYPREARAPLGESSARARLRELAPLVSDLGQLTTEEDLLILSPSGVLNCLPIHALPVGDKTLIERNPIVYSSNSAIFGHAQMRAVSQATNPSHPTERASLLSVYESDGIQGRAERDAIYKHANEVSKMMAFHIRTGDEASKSSFKEAASSSDWIHYHGHALFDKRDVLRSCLVLAGGLEEAQASADTTHLSATEASNASRNLTVADIFEVDMHVSAPHVTVMACDSGTQDIAAGNEPLGIIPALLYAGATSVVGALWPVESAAARRFSELFYSHLRVQRDASPRKKVMVLNLAQALRSSVCEMMRRENVDTKVPLHWAPYVLYGCWFRGFQPSSTAECSKFMGGSTEFAMSPEGTL
ncbi:hypothetical protein PV11_04786 [Exophiala sideris]|uniref:CHAT domain-containing protein n=1 Tax=Exophiala sideris TaxID=1016849 RepID=A0A0D1W1P5_9EURO|nr:hypothetical protein PV11_04786 [Exophiala sideris]